MQFYSIPLEGYFFDFMHFFLVGDTFKKLINWLLSEFEGSVNPDLNHMPIEPYFP